MTMRQVYNDGVKFNSESRNESMSKAKVAFATVLTIFVLIPSIVWLTMGYEYVDDPRCKVASGPDLATWLVVLGVLGIIEVVFLPMAIYGVMIKGENDLCMFMGVTSCTIIIMTELLLFAWFIVGVIRLNDNAYCHERHMSLYNAVLGALVFTFFRILAVGGIFKTQIEYRAFMHE